MEWFGAGHVNTPSSTQTNRASRFLYVRFQKRAHMLQIRAHFLQKITQFLVPEMGTFLVPEMGTSFYVSTGRTQKLVPNMSPFLEPENSDFGCRASVKYMIRSKLTNHVQKDCFYQAHMSCNTAPCLEVLQGF